MQGGPPSHGASAFVAGGFHDVDVIGDLGEASWEGAGCVRDDGVTAFGEGSDHDEVSDHDGRCGLAWNAEDVVRGAGAEVAERTDEQALVFGDGAVGRLGSVECAGEEPSVRVWPWAAIIRVQERVGWRRG